MEIKVPEPITIDAISAEVARARHKFPNGKYLLAALVEEVGELSQAMMEASRGPDVSHARQPRKRYDRDDIIMEAIQVAAMAIRIIEEGDPDFPASLPPRPDIGPTDWGPEEDT